MELIAKRQHIRVGFIVLASIGLLFNLLFDSFAFSAKKKSDIYSEQVNNSFTLQTHLRDIRNLLASAPNDMRSDPEIQTHLKEIQRLSSTPEDMRSAAALADLINRDSEESVFLAEKYLTQEEIAFKDKIARDIQQDAVVDNSMMRALVTDFLLIFFLLGLFVLNINSRRKIENNLRESLNMMSEAFNGLQEENLRQRMHLKTTVHDLKNPIGSIAGFAEVMEDHANSSEAVLQFSERIKQISKRSLALVEDILSEETTQSSLFEVIDLSALVNEVCLQMEGLAQQKDQILVKEKFVSTAMIQGHRTKLHELIENIIGNAVKYSPIGEKITVRCFNRNNYWRVEVEDHGPGFSEDDKHGAFQYGRTLSAKPTAHETTSGFGLYIAKQVVELHKGRIQILDGAVQGSLVSVDIPVFQQVSPETSPISII